MSNNSSRSSNNLVVPEAREAMDRFKMEAANEVGVQLKQGYNGDLTSREAGSIGGQMVKKICPVQTNVFDRPLRCVENHQFTVTYKTTICV